LPPWKLFCLVIEARNWNHSHTKQWKNSNKRPPI
jgi:hypothetical protein